MSRELKITRVSLLVIIVMCVVSCGVAWIYQGYCMFEVEPLTKSVPAGSDAHFTLLQWDCLFSVFGHACYNEPDIQVEGLPTGSAVKRIEWIGCHESDLTIITQASTPAGVYQLTIKPEGSRISPEHVTLEIVNP
jgi:hypothetical protein